MKIVSAEVVPWEDDGTWGVFVRYDDAERLTFYVGPKEQAESEAKALLAREQIRLVE